MGSNYQQPQSKQQAFKDTIYLSYNENIGTQSGEQGTTLISPSSWNVSKLDSIYFADPRGADNMLITIPDASVGNKGRTITFRKPNLAGDMGTITLVTESGQNIGPKPIYEFDHPGEHVQLVSNDWEFAGGDYKWRQSYDSRSATGVITVSEKGITGFSTIKSAVEQANDRSVLDGTPWLVQVNPGTYRETAPIRLNDNVSIAGDSAHSVKVLPDDVYTEKSLFVLGNESLVSNMTLEHIPSGATIQAVSGVCYVQNIELEDIKYGIYADNVISPANPYGVGTGGVTVITDLIVLHEHNVFGSIIYTNNDTVSATPIGVAFRNSVILSEPGTTIEAIVDTNGRYSQVGIFDVQARVRPTSQIIYGYKTSGGSSLELGGSTFMQGVSVGIVGSGGSNINAQGIVIKNSVYKDIIIEDTTTTANIMGTYGDETKAKVAAGNTGVVLTRGLIGSDKNGFFVSGKLLQENNTDGIGLDIGDLLREGTGLGLLSGGDVFQSSTTTVNVSAGNGYAYGAPSESIKFVEWDDTVVTIPAAPGNYVIRYLTSTDSVAAVIGSVPPLSIARAVIPFANVIYDGTEIVHFRYVARPLMQYPLSIDLSLREGLGPVWGSNGEPTLGTPVSAGHINIGGVGIYYYGNSELKYGSGDDIIWKDVYKDITNPSGLNYTFSEGISTINTTQYSNTSGLELLPSNTYAKHLIYATGAIDSEDCHYDFVYATDFYTTSAEAILASPPESPSWLEKKSMTLANIVVHQTTDASVSGGVISLQDARPKLATGATTGTAGGGGTGGVTDHGALNGLSDDDHTQYLLVNGSRPMGGSLDMGSNNIITVGTVDGVDVSTHASRHNPDGSDSITTAVAVSITDSSNSTGSNNSVSRSDHTHSHGNRSGGTLHSVATTSVDGFMSSTDKIELNGNTEDITNIASVSASWDSTHTTVNSNSADWANHFDATEVQAASGNWDTAYTKSLANEADITNVALASAGWDSTETTVNVNSADWDNAGGTTSYYSASSNTLTTFAGTTDTLIAGMTVTPTAGIYYVIASIPVVITNKLGIGYLSIYYGGTEAIAAGKTFNTLRTAWQHGVTTIAIVNVNGAQAIEARWSITGAGQLEATPRTIVAMKVIPGE